MRLLLNHRWPLFALFLILAVGLTAKEKRTNGYPDVPFTYEYTISPDVEYYDPGVVVTVNFSVRMDTTVTWPEDAVDRDYIVWVEHNVGDTRPRSGYQGFRLISMEHKVSPLLNRQNPTFSNQLIFETVNGMGRFLYIAQILQLTDDPGGLPLPDTDYRVTPALSGDIFMQSTAWRNRSGGWIDGPAEYPKIHPAPVVPGSGRPDRAVLLGTNIEITFPDTIFVDDPYIVEVTGPIGEIDGDQCTDHSILLQVTNDYEHLENTAQIYPVSGEDWFIMVQVVDHYPLHGRIEFEEHSPDIYGNIAFFQEPGCYADSAGFMSPGLGKVLIWGSGPEPVDEAVINPNGSFSFTSLSVAEPTIQVILECDDVVGFQRDADNLAYRWVHTGVQIYHPEFFPFTWNGGSEGVRLSVQFNPLNQSNDTYVLMNPLEVYEGPHVLIRNHTFCAGSHALKEFQRAKQTAYSLGSETNNEDLAVFCDMLNPIEEYPFYVRSEFFHQVFQGCHLQDYDGVHLYSSLDGNWPLHTVFTNKRWDIWNPNIYFHEMGHYFYGSD